MRLMLLLALLALGASLRAADNGSKRYLKLKDSADAYVGEGVAKLAEFDGDGLKALEAARERARGSLASAVRVRIVSETREQSSSGPEGSTETVESKSASLADVILENVRIEDFIGLPAEGQVTALAIVSKEDYRRQLAGKAAPLYRPQYGLKLAVWGWSQPSIEAIENTGTMNSAPTDAPVNMGGNGASGSSVAPGFGLEFVWRDFSLGLDYYRKELGLYLYDDKLNQYNVRSDGISIAMASLGWQYIPWPWRVQPFVPFGVHVANVNLFQGQVIAMGASAGLGIRYWPSDAFSFELCVRFLQGLNTQRFQGGGPIYLRKGQEAEFNLTSPQARVAIQWSGY